MSIYIFSFTFNDLNKATTKTFLPVTLNTPAVSARKNLILRTLYAVRHLPSGVFTPTGPLLSRRFEQQMQIEQQPDLLILDLGLPDGDGMALLAELRTFSKIPLIVLSMLRLQQRLSLSQSAALTPTVTISKAG